MTTDFTLSTKTRTDAFSDIVSVGDVVSYSFDCSPWADDNAAVSSATWTVESGQASISGQAIASNVLSATVSFSKSGRVLISILLSTATGVSKKIWLEIGVKDVAQQAEDYGFVG